MKGLDINVLVRYLINDDIIQSKQAISFIENNCTESTPCFVGHIVLCELAWVLENNYQQNREQIVFIIEQLLKAGELEVMKPDVVWSALNDYRLSNADFPDHLLARANQAKGCDVTVTFDKKAAKQPAFELIIPS